MQIYTCCLVKNCNKHAPIKNFLKLDIYRCNSSQCQLTLIFATSIHQIRYKMNEKWNVIFVTLCFVILRVTSRFSRCQNLRHSNTWTNANIFITHGLRNTRALNLRTAILHTSPYFVRMFNDHPIVNRS